MSVLPTMRPNHQRNVICLTASASIHPCRRLRCASFAQLSRRSHVVAPSCQRDEATTAVQAMLIEAAGFKEELIVRPDQLVVRVGVPDVG
jgi:hypothetical protein